MHVRQAANVLELLEFFARRGSVATLAEIADELGWPRSSTFNLVNTLADAGFLYEPFDRRGYYPTPRWLMLAQRVAEAEPLPGAIHELAAEVARRTGETTAIGAPAGVHASLLDVAESAHAVRFFARIGDRIPIHASSLGRALLAQYAPAERQALYRRIRFERYSQTTPMAPEAIESAIAEGERRGYHRSDHEYLPDLAGVALPLPLPHRRLSIVVAGPVSRCLEHRDAIARTVRDLRDRCLAALEDGGAG
ncbi:IclR family transcriptional regulator [Pseudoxanthomonas broegbernensis]|uniref:IclR family transcriptional regulator n=1 Tax=Pseudoxanthomonas broegbernensis TaxID=83619 RepID=A0A7V8GMW3_9GAMM|nr:IclR family transcriptional regulator [Pseudoxanthomonas broegbernensis]KAF1686722.1 IclR family transcriptional regulator [Pseudoxanthomonas broegbernensis]MBB6063511.1 DNA-binding IclR family transcriptional regulator [Pseudoxanthomonas broegbernensis]